jgi:arginase family enzyme
MRDIACHPFLNLLRENNDAASWRHDPRPGWCGVATLFGNPLVNIDEVGAADYVAVGVPFDSTTSSRPGAAEGPDGIRRASRVFASYLESLGEHDMLDTRTDETFRYKKPRILDVGDVHVYPTDLPRTFRSLATAARDLAQTGATLIILGGDHSITFPMFAGVQEAARKVGRESTIGYIQVDHHFDFGDRSLIHGLMYHGSNARRISELPGMAAERIAFVGVGATTRLDQFRYLRQTGFNVVTAAILAKREVASPLIELVDRFRNRCTSVYLSIDIDVLDCATAPGTGNVTCGGMDGATLVDTLRLLADLPFSAIDLVEVAPRYDPSGRTCQLAAQMIVELIFRSKRESKSA